MTLSYEKYLDKVKACFIGKNIGGTLGGPYEWAREMLDVKGFTTPPGKPLPNDDLDLQLVWLHALEQVGPYAIDANLLGEFWLNYIHPYWNEYGIGKANMQRGFAPPVSGELDNDWKHSNGAWIRTEVWACTAPATPETAVYFAIEDAKVDHGAGEGTVAAAFVATLQSAAFALSDIKDCIALGLTSVPPSSRVAKSVQIVLDAHAKGKCWQEAREEVRLANMDIGNGYFEAPSNIAYAVIGMLYGEGDFKKSVLTALNCGDDTDCTAATVGATLGILYGTAGIPRDWAEYIGDEIVTVSLAKGDVGNWFPKSCTEMASRIAEVMPTVMRVHNAYFLYKGNDAITTVFGKEKLSGAFEQLQSRIQARVLPLTAALTPYTLTKTEGPFSLSLSLSDVRIAPEKEITLSLTVALRVAFENRQYPLSIRFILPNGFDVTGAQSVLVKRDEASTDGKHGLGRVTVPFTLRAGTTVGREERVILELTVPGRHTAIYLPFLLTKM
ncbi:MAG: ADP-ribosylglycohydrolase family protein [Clostridia bacterium]|nr:ADP-ribosylglycohydrolase family protein [Clostridia bacterium]